MSPASSRVPSRTLVLEFRLGLGSLVPQALLVILQLDPRPSGDVEHAPDGDDGRQEDDRVEDGETLKRKQLGF